MGSKPDISGLPNGIDDRRDVEADVVQPVSALGDPIGVNAWPIKGFDEFDLRVRTDQRQPHRESAWRAAIAGVLQVLRAVGVDQPVGSPQNRTPARHRCVKVVDEQPNLPRR